MTKKSISKEQEMLKSTYDSLFGKLVFSIIIAAICFIILFFTPIFRVTGFALKFNAWALILLMFSIASVFRANFIDSKMFSTRLILDSKFPGWDKDDDL